METIRRSAAFVRFIMLHILPNELLVKVFRKTKSRTTKECRFLNTHFNEVITKYKLNKVDIDTLTISPLKICLIATESEKTKEISFESYEDFLICLPDVMNRIRRVDFLCLNEIVIDENVIKGILEEKSLSQIRMLKIRACGIADNLTTKWLSFLEKLFLDDLDIGIQKQGTIIPVPESMLRRITKSIQCHSSRTWNAVDMSWFDDEFLENWYSKDKKLDLHNCQTSLTIGGVIKFLQKYAGYGDSEEHIELGTIINTPPQLIVNALRAARIECQCYDTADRLNLYCVLGVGKTSLYAFFTCKKPENEGRNN